MRGPRGDAYLMRSLRGGPPVPRPAERNGLGLELADALANVRALRGRTSLLAEDGKVADRLLALLDDIECGGSRGMLYEYLLGQPERVPDRSRPYASPEIASLHSTPY